MYRFDIKITKKPLVLMLGICLSVCGPAAAESDMQLQEKALKAREISRGQEVDHSAHIAGDETGGFRGVFYGYLPCNQKGCDGIKMTLSLKPRNNYLLVTQYARESSREYYDKGKYEWNDKTAMLTLVSNKDGGKRLLRIQDAGALVQLDNDGKPLSGDQDDYTLRRSDKAKSREVHIH